MLNGGEFQKTSITVSIPEEYLSENLEGLFTVAKKDRCPLRTESRKIVVVEKQ